MEGVKRRRDGRRWIHAEKGGTEMAETEEKELEMKSQEKRWTEGNGRDRSGRERDLGLAPRSTVTFYRK